LTRALPEKLKSTQAKQVEDELIERDRGQGKFGEKVPASGRDEKSPVISFF
jgi:hypothetical protein